MRGAEHFTPSAIGCGDYFLLSSSAFIPVCSGGRSRASYVFVFAVVPSQPSSFSSRWTTREALPA